MAVFDTTDLTVSNGLKDNGAVMIHRDYIAHCFRWSFATRRVGNIKFKGGLRNILDFGCGKDMPFADTLLCSRRRDAVGHYTGVDLNKIEAPKWRKSIEKMDKFEFLGNTNILDVTPEMLGDIDTITSFEVFEHCPIEKVAPILRHLHSLMVAPDGEFIYSTPVFHEGRGAAKNHLSEMSRDYFGWLLEETGHTIVENYGTFASQSDYKKHLSPAQLEVFNELVKYHESSVLANFLAPVVPHLARNNIWVCNKRVEGDERKFPTEGSKPWGQWETDNG